MGLKEQIDSQIKEAMRNKEKDELRALRAIKSLILLAESEERGKTLSEAEEMQILQKAAKQRKDSLAIYEKEGRTDLASVESSELAIIERFLPEQLSDEEISEKVREVIAKTGATSMKDMGKVMGMASGELSGKADNKKVAEIVKKLLSNQ